MLLQRTTQKDTRLKTDKAHLIYMKRKLIQMQDFDIQ